MDFTLIFQTGKGELSGMNYFEWNELLAEHFFKDDKAYEDVIIYVNEDIISQIGTGRSSTQLDFINAIRAGPFETQNEEICEDAFSLYQNWRTKFNSGFPPYIAYLSFFVLVAAKEDHDFAPHAYYPKMWRLLGHDGKHDTPSKFNKMPLLWEDLEKWSCEEKHGALGKFLMRVRGKKRFVGIPLFQTLFSIGELRLLPQMFKEANLDPLDVPAPEVMMEILSKYGKEIFRNRTLKMISDESSESNAFKSAMINLVLEQLEEWDGTYSDSKSTASAKQLRVQTELRICLNLDQLSGSVKCYIRFRSRRTIPEEGLILLNPRTSERYICHGYTNGWSSYLSQESEDKPEKVKAENFDWEQGEKLEDETGQWKAVLRPSNTRVFQKAVDNLRDWVEIQRVEKGKEYLIASKPPDADKVSTWGETSVEDFMGIESSGLPQGWKLYSCKSIAASCAGIDLLTISNQARLTLAGGIKARGRNSFFEFAKPKILLENGAGGEIIKVNGQAIVGPDSPGEWTLPQASSTGETYDIEALQGDEVIDRKIIHINSFDTLPDFGNTPFRSPSGDLTAVLGRSQYAQGALVTGANLAEYNQVTLPFHLSDRIIFLGEVPGQIADWPEENISNDWKPFWAITKTARNHWRAYYCGDSISNPNCASAGSSGMSKKDVKRWKEAIYFRRKVTAFPELSILRELWNSYQECAKNVK